MSETPEIHHAPRATENPAKRKRRTYHHRLIATLTDERDAARAALAETQAQLAATHALLLDAEYATVSDEKAVTRSGALAYALLGALAGLALGAWMVSP